MERLERIALEGIGVLVDVTKIKTMEEGTAHIFAKYGQSCRLGSGSGEGYSVNMDIPNGGSVNLPFNHLNTSEKFLRFVDSELKKRELYLVVGELHHGGFNFELLGELYSVSK